MSILKQQIKIRQRLSRYPAVRTFYKGHYYLKGCHIIVHNFAK